MAAQFHGNGLIFIISQPRAGSTLLQRILAGHPEIHTSAEPWLMLHPIYALKRDGIKAEYNASLARAALSDFLNYYGNGEETYLEALRTFANLLYGRALAGTGKRFFLDKTPRYYFIIPELQRLFPEAKFILLIRNPLAVLQSILSTWVKENWLQLVEFRHDLLTGPERILQGAELLADKALMVRYEELVMHPEESARRLCAYLEVECNQNLLGYDDHPAPLGRMGDSVGVYQHSRPAMDSLAKWKALGSTTQTKHLALAYIDALGAELVDRLGYDYEELREGIERAQPEKHHASLPWNTLIRPQDEWTRDERLHVYRAMAVQQKGRLRGNLTFVRDNALALARSLLPD